MLSRALVTSMVTRAARTFLQTFLAVLLASPVLDLSGPVLKAAALAGLASVLALAHRALDETRFPSLPDRTAPPAAAPTTTTGAA